MIARFLIAASAAALVAALPAAAQQFTMKIASVPQKDPIEAYGNKVKQRLEAKTGGRMKVEVYPGAQLGPEPRLLDGLQLGTVEQAAFPPVYLKGLDPRFQIVEAPGVFKSMRQAHLTVNDPAIRGEFLSLLEPKKLVGGGIFAYTTIGYIAKSPIRTIDDYKGKKFRVIASDAERGLMTSLGATGVPISLGELTPALQSGVVDGVRSGVVIFTIFKFYTLAKYQTITRDTPVIVIMFTSKPWLDKLPADLRKDVLDVSAEETAKLDQTTSQFLKNAIAGWKAGGGEHVSLNAPDQAELLKRARAVSDKVFGEDPALAPMYKKVLEVAKKYENEKDPS
jgi:TRAP-type C4-dicarboxylate transport system substrate-binding protein